MTNPLLLVLQPIVQAPSDSGNIAQQLAAPIGALCNVDNSTRDFWDQVYGCQTLKSWTLFFAILLGSVILAKVFYWVSGKVLKKMVKKTKTNLDDLLVDMLEEPVVLLIVGLGIWLGYETCIDYTIARPEVHDFAIATISGYFTIAITWLISRTVDALIVEYIVPLVEKTEGELDNQILPIIRKGLRIIIWSLGIIIALQNAGFNITALIAGLGVGGLALALAAQDTVKNLFGGIMIFADKPFLINERIKVEGFDGFVEEIGIRSTRLRTLEGRLVTIPNAKFSESSIENVSSEPSRKVVLNIGLTYSMTGAQIEQAINILKEIRKNHNNLEEDGLISFNSFGDFSLGILFIYYIKAEGDIFQTQTDVNLAILNRFNATGLEMAFPTSTIYTIAQNASHSEPQQPSGHDNM